MLPQKEITVVIKAIEVVRAAQALFLHEHNVAWLGCAFLLLISYLPALPHLGLPAL
jgi:hypothetical protein